MKDRFFSPQEIAEMEAVFNERFMDSMNRDENISFEGYVSEDTLYITLNLFNEDHSFYYPVETAVSIKDNPKIEEDEAKLCLLDFIGTYFEAYFESKRVTLMPIDWTSYSMNGRKIYAKAQIVNKKLEKQADDILKSAGFEEEE